MGSGEEQEAVARINAGERGKEVSLSLLPGGGRGGVGDKGEGKRR